MNFLILFEEVRKMTYEKSCGAVVFRNERHEGNLQRYVLMIRHSLHSHHSFPKGSATLAAGSMPASDKGKESLKVKLPFSARSVCSVG